MPQRWRASRSLNSSFHCNNFFSPKWVEEINRRTKIELSFHIWWFWIIICGAVKNVTYCWLIWELLVLLSYFRRTKRNFWNLGTQTNGYDGVENALTHHAFRSRCRGLASFRLLTYGLANALSWTWLSSPNCVGEQPALCESNWPVASSIPPVLILPVLVLKCMTLSASHLVSSADFKNIHCNDKLALEYLLQVSPGLIRLNSHEIMDGWLHMRHLRNSFW